MGGGGACMTAQADLRVRFFTSVAGNRQTARCQCSFELELARAKIFLFDAFSRPTGCCPSLRSLSPPAQSRKPNWQGLDFLRSDVAFCFTAILVAHFCVRSLPARIVYASLTS